MIGDSRVAIFVNAENVCQWLKTGGTESLRGELSSVGVGI